jgi:hypothetical protein
VSLGRLHRALSHLLKQLHRQHHSLLTVGIGRLLWLAHSLRTSTEKTGRRLPKTCPHRRARRTTGKRSRERRRPGRQATGTKATGQRAESAADETTSKRRTGRQEIHNVCRKI